MTLKVASLALLCFSIAACSKTESGTSAQAPYTDSYEYNDNGCSTGRHQFKSATQADVRFKYCTTLQDDEANNGCALSWRMEKFESYCKGMEWDDTLVNPVDVPVPGPTPATSATPVPAATPRGPVSTPAPTPAVNPVRDAAAEAERQKLETDLTLLLMEPMLANVEMRGNIVGDAALEAWTVSKAIDDCGLTMSGPLCFEDKASMAAVHSFLDDTTKRPVFVSRIEGKYTLLFHIASVMPLEIYEVEIIKEIRAPRLHHMKEYLADDSAYLSLATGSIVGDQVPALQSLLYTPKNLRSLYFTARFLTSLKLGSTENSKLVARCVENSVNYIGDHDLEPVYQRAFIELIDERLPMVARDPLIELLKKLVLKSDRDLRVTAAAMLLKRQPQMTSLKPMVVEALSNERASVRKDALDSLIVAGNLSPRERSLVIGMIEDSDSYVAATAIVHVERSLDIDESNIPALEKITKSDSSHKRESILPVISRIPGVRALQILLNVLTDEDVEVRTKAYELLVKREVASNDLAALLRAADSTNPSTREVAVILLAKLDGDNVTVALMKRLSDESERVVQKTFESLEKRNLKPEQLGVLTNYARLATPAGRIAVAKLMSKVDSDAVTSLLILRLSDEDEGVRAQLIELIDQRAMGEKELPQLMRHFSHEKAEVRLVVAKWVAKTKSPYAPIRLKAWLAYENDPKVKQAIEEAIKSLSN